MTSTVTDAKLGNLAGSAPSSISMGRFRMTGDTYPFWAETLNASRGPMSVPAAVFSGHTIQAAAFRNDPAGPAIEVTVHIEIEVGQDGRVKNMKVLSGNAQFVPDAKRYLQEAEFAKMPDDLRFAKAKGYMEVVFFAPKLPMP